MDEREEPQKNVFEVSREFVFDTGEPMLLLPDVRFENRFDHSIREIQLNLEKSGLAIVTAPSGVGKTELLVGRGLASNYFVPGGLEQMFDQMGLTWVFMSFQSATISSNDLDTPDKLIERKKRFDRTQRETRRGEGGWKIQTDVIPNEADVWVMDESVILERDVNLAKWLLDIKKSGKKLLLLGGGSCSSQDQANRIGRSLVYGGWGNEVKESAVYLKPHLFTRPQAIELLTTASHMPENMAGKIIELLQENRLPLLPRVVWMAGLPYDENRPIPTETKLEWIKDSMGYKGTNFRKMYCGHIKEI